MLAFKVVLLSFDKNVTLLVSKMKFYPMLVAPEIVLPSQDEDSMQETNDRSMGSGNLFNAFGN